MEKQNKKFQNIDVVILSGGKGTRLYPLTANIPKPMVKIGNLPVLEHIIRHFAHFGYFRIKLLVGFQAQKIIDHFSNSKLFGHLDLKFIDTGVETNTAQRLFQVKDQLSDPFWLAYADILSDVSLPEVLNFHLKKKKVGTMVCAPLPTSYGVVMFNRHYHAYDYLEKPTFSDRWINAGFFIFGKELFSHWEDLDPDFSKGMLIKLAKEKKMACYLHRGFWSGMDTVRENEILNDLWQRNEAKWAIWRK